MTDVRILNPLNVPNWDDMIAPLPGVSFFHSSAWARVLFEAYKYKPTYFLLFENERMAGLLPMMDVNSFLTGHRGVSLPFTDFCEPLVENSSQFQELFNSALSYGNKNGWKYIEIRGGQHLFPDAPAFQTLFFHTLDIRSDEDKMMAGFRDSTRRNIKKALAEGVTAKILDTMEGVRQFARLNLLTRKEHGLPPQPGRFFRAMYRHIIAEGHGFVALAYFREKPVAGNVFFCAGDRAIYKYGASDKRFQNLRASNLAMWEGIRWLCRNGGRELHLGKTEHIHKGLRQYKLGWGTQEQTAAYLRYDMGRMNFVRDRKSEGSPFRDTVFKKTPIPFLRILGAAAYRHMA